MEKQKGIYGSEYGGINEKIINLYINCINVSNEWL